MIISDAEIRNALELTRPRRRTRVPVMSPDLPIHDPASPSKVGPAHPMAPDPDVRIARLKGLRERLRAGTYDVVPDSVAEKMIGRAIVDQIAQLVDRAEGADEAGD
jgi:hypothetical protein